MMKKKPMKISSSFMKTPYQSLEKLVQWFNSRYNHMGKISLVLARGLLFSANLEIKGSKRFLR